jgi:CHAT domain-containing protein
MNEKYPQLSGLAFSQPDDTISGEDGILYSGEIYTLDLHADLVVLSSCESGIGRLAKGEGMFSLTRGFIYAGANNVVVSLWKVYDKHTSKLMIEFYRGIAAGQDYSTALHNAKLKMLQNEDTAFPVSWAGFVLVGV